MAQIIFAVFMMLMSTQVLASGPRWLVYYGESLSQSVLSRVNIAIVDPDHLKPSPGKTTYYAYISVGEAEKYRAYWPRVEGKSYLVEPNPDWGGNLRVDVRDPEWRRLLLEDYIPSLVKKGFHGLFLDTIDTAAYLESKDPKRYAGSQAAMVGLIKDIKKRFPSLKLLPNNGLPMLEDYGAEVAGVVVEDLYTRYDFVKKKSGPTPEADSVEKEKYLDAFRKKFGKPVLVILYDSSATTPLAQSAIARCEKKGYRWYLTTVDLQQLGTIE